jgi:hypothetical protein
MASLASRISSTALFEAKVELAAPSTRLIIVSNRVLSPIETSSLQQHGSLVVLNPCDLPPISIPIENLLCKPVSFLFLNLSIPTVRYWIQARVNILSAIPHIILRGAGESETQDWMAQFLPCPVLKRIEGAFQLSDFMSQMLHFVKIPKPQSGFDRGLNCLFGCLRDNGPIIDAAATHI